MALKYPKPKAKRYLFNIDFISCSEKSYVNIDLIALSENDLKVTFKRIYKNATLILVNSCIIIK
jgi:hypothetical protein